MGILDFILSSPWRFVCTLVLILWFYYCAMLAIGLLMKAAL